MMLASYGTSRTGLQTKQSFSPVLSQIRIRQTSTRLTWLKRSPGFLLRDRAVQGPPGPTSLARKSRPHRRQILRALDWVL
ncbi:uncharacterized protein M6B38_401290 [Iris pallida]|uniref:Uncharacterized protein n=1 Tax=Iris pallida TaxID=29817 RepID=A0AAX6FUY6_IRIPA|nr:uncharacterized protein M6B38_401290 [Iris pallida]